MNPTQSAIVLTFWLAWLGFWIILANSPKVPGKAVARRETDRSRRLQSFPLIAGGLLAGLPDLGIAGFDLRYLPSGSPAAGTVGIALVAAGLLFTVWARVFLAGNWSVSVTLKIGHELVRGGPYAWVRHPIYTGALVALAGTAICGGEWRGLIGIGLVTASLVYKIEVEERWLTEHFGDAYLSYRKEVAALMPCVY